MGVGAAMVDELFIVRAIFDGRLDAFDHLRRAHRSLRPVPAKLGLHDIPDGSCQPTPRVIS